MNSAGINCFSYVTPSLVSNRRWESDGSNFSQKGKPIIFQVSPNTQLTTSTLTDFHRGPHQVKDCRNNQRGAIAESSSRTVYRLISFAIATGIYGSVGLIILRLRTYFTVDLTLLTLLASIAIASSLLAGPLTEKIEDVITLPFLSTLSWLIMSISLLILPMGDLPKPVNITLGGLGCVAAGLNHKCATSNLGLAAFHIGQFIQFLAMGLEPLSSLVVGLVVSFVFGMEDLFPAVFELERDTKLIVTAILGAVLLCPAIMIFASSERHLTKIIIRDCRLNSVCEEKEGEDSDEEKSVDIDTPEKFSHANIIHIFRDEWNVMIQADATGSFALKDTMKIQKVKKSKGPAQNSRRTLSSQRRPSTSSVVSFSALQLYHNRPLSPDEKMFLWSRSALRISSNSSKIITFAVANLILYLGIFIPTFAMPSVIGKIVWDPIVGVVCLMTSKFFGIVFFRILGAKMPSFQPVLCLLSMVLCSGSLMGALAYQRTPAHALIGCCLHHFFAFGIVTLTPFTLAHWIDQPSHAIHWLTVVNVARGIGVLIGPPFLIWLSEGNLYTALIYSGITVIPGSVLMVLQLVLEAFQSFSKKATTSLP